MAGVNGGAFAVPAGRLHHLPLALFAAPMGLGGLGLAWREAAHGLPVPGVVGEALLALAALVYAALLVLHLRRGFAHPAALATDLRHPVRAAFAGAVSIGLMLNAAALLPYAPTAALVLWAVAVLLHLAIGAVVLRRLIAAPNDPAILTPPILIPLVGNLVAPVVGARLGLETLSWMLFGIGLLLWLMLQPLVLHRLIAGPPLPPRLRPTLVILLAPPSVACLAVAALIGSALTPVALGLFGLAAFMALVLLSLVRGFAAMPFAPSWWAWTFPPAAFATALISVAQQEGSTGLQVLAVWVLLAVTAITALVALRTLRAAVSGDLLQPEGG